MELDTRNAMSVARELEFTRIFDEHAGSHPYVREVRCLEYQVPTTLMPIQPGDWFAGRLERLAVGVDPERGGLCEAAFFCQFDVLEKRLSSLAPDSPLYGQIKWLTDYWRDKHTMSLCRKAFPGYVQQGIPSDDYYGAENTSYPMYGLGGPCIDFGKLIKKGVSGLRAEVDARMARCSDPESEEQIFLNCLGSALDIFSRAALEYASQASEIAQSTGDAATRARLGLIAESLQRISTHAPDHFHQAIQLMWLYSLVALPRNYGRMDVYLGDLLASDLDDGSISYDEAKAMLTGLWQLIIARGDRFNNRVIIGGRGRPNEKNADLFALLALEVQAAVRDSLPQLSVRWYQGMAPAIWEKAIEVIGLGSTFPIIYNDDVNIPAVAKAFDVSLEEAEDYVMYGCGEFVINHKSVGSPDAALNVVKCLNATLYNGLDFVSDTPQGLALGTLTDCGTFDQLKSAFARQVDYQASMLADVQDMIYRVTGECAAFPFLSLLYDDCIERARPLLAGGARYRGGTIETFGNHTAADALSAIKKLVYDEKRIGRAELLGALKDGFEGHEEIRMKLKAAPKYGNDDAEADAMSCWLNTTLGESCRRQRECTELDSFLVVLVNNGDHVVLGRGTGASADGRRAGTPLSNGNQPTAGNDVQGLTALLNSMAKLDPGTHAGATQNIKFDRRMFAAHRERVSAVLKAYFASGGTQFMVTVVDRQELEAAMERPEEYGNLIVRVGGYSARFVDLPRDVQQDVIKRTLYEE